MSSWRITKYNPAYRNDQGIYQKDEWTSFSDIGKKKHNRALTYEAYKKTEDAYVNAIHLFMECNNLETLKVVGLEKRDEWRDDVYAVEDMKNVFNTIHNDEYCSKKVVEVVARLVLREKLWCKLESRSMFVHFGYDYYMYIGSMQAGEKQLQKIQESGLYVEAYESPYRNDQG